MTVTISLPMPMGRQAGGSYAGGAHSGALRLTRHSAGAVDLLQ